MNESQREEKLRLEKYLRGRTIIPAFRIIKGYRGRLEKQRCVIYNEDRREVNNICNELGITRKEFKKIRRKERRNNARN